VGGARGGDEQFVRVWRAQRQPRLPALAAVSGQLTLGAPPARWRLRDPEARAKGIPRLPPVVATVLAARGITTREQADIFYNPHPAPAYDPPLLPGLHQAIRSTPPALGA